MAQKINMNSLTDQVKSAFLGVAVGDAVGVPVEFKPREYLKRVPVTDMIGFGTYSLKPGTWSDDSSLTFCLAEALTQDFRLENVATNFLNWYEHAYWTAEGEVFDIGITTQDALDRLLEGVSPESSGDTRVDSNGNGSLMRILPLLFYIQDKPIRERFELTRQVSCITHAHIRSVLACFIYLEYARYMLQGQDKFEALKTIQDTLPTTFAEWQIPAEEVRVFDRIFTQNIHELTEDDIQSSGYVLHTLEASLWCFLQTNNYASAVLKAVNLGKDTDTTAAVTGGLAGLTYGWGDIPVNWLNQTLKVSEIMDLAERVAQKLETLA